MCVCTGRERRGRGRERGEREREREREKGRGDHIKSHIRCFVLINNITNSRIQTRSFLVIFLYQVTHLQSPKKSELFCCKLTTPGCKGGLDLGWELDGEKVW